MKRQTTFADDDPGAYAPRRKRRAPQGAGNLIPSWFTAEFAEDAADFAERFGLGEPFDPRAPLDTQWEQFKGFVVGHAADMFAVAEAVEDSGLTDVPPGTAQVALKHRLAELAESDPMLWEELVRGRVAARPAELRPVQLVTMFADDWARFAALAWEWLSKSTERASLRADAARQATEAAAAAAPAPEAPEAWFKIFGVNRYTNAEVGVPAWVGELLVHLIATHNDAPAGHQLTAVWDTASGEPYMRATSSGAYALSAWELSKAADAAKRLLSDALGDGYVVSIAPCDKPAGDTAEGLLPRFSVDADELARIGAYDWFNRHASPWLGYYGPYPKAYKEYPPW